MIDEPVQRYLSHTNADRAPLQSGARLTMRGRIKVGRWLAFEADQEFRGHAFTWSARAGLGPWRPLRVTDRYADGAGSMKGTAFGRLRFLDAQGEDVTRSSAGRSAAESIWVPQTLLPSAGAQWRTEAENVIVATIEVPPERVDVRLEIDAAGAPRTVSIQRWGDVGRDGFGYIPFGGQIHAERRFGELVLPSRVTVGWWFGTPRFEPFFSATILSAVAIP